MEKAIFTVPASRDYFRAKSFSSWEGMNTDIYSINVLLSLCLYSMVSAFPASVQVLFGKKNLSQSLLRQLSGLYPVKSPWVGRTSGKV